MKKGGGLTLEVGTKVAFEVGIRLERFQKAIGRSLETNMSSICLSAIQRAIVVVAVSRAISEPFAGDEVDRTQGESARKNHRVSELHEDTRTI